MRHRGRKIVLSLSGATAVLVALSGCATSPAESSAAPTPQPTVTITVTETAPPAPAPSAPPTASEIDGQAAWLMCRGAAAQYSATDNLDWTLLPVRDESITDNGDGTYAVAVLWETDSTGGQFACTAGGPAADPQFEVQGPSDFG